MSDLGTRIRSFFKDYPSKTLEKGQSIFQIGDQVEKVQYLKSGNVIEYDITPAGNTIIINAFKPGSFFPMSCVLNNQPTSYIFEASSDVEIIEAPKEDVINFLSENNDILLDLLKRVYIGTDGILKRMTYLMGGYAIDRVRYELLNASYRFGKTQPNGDIYIPLSENDLAQRSGLSRETVNRSMKDLKNEQLIEISKGSIIIKNLTAIEQLLLQ